MLKERLQQEHPPLKTLKNVYQALANYYKLAVGSGEGQGFDFDIHQFSEQYKFNHLEVFYSLKKLEEDGIVQLNESFHSPSQVHIHAGNTELYKFQVANAKYDPFIKALLRLYGGELFNGFVTIYEAQIAKLLGISSEEVIKIMERLQDMDLLIYDKKKDKPQLIFLLPRQPVDQMGLDQQRLKIREEIARKKVDAVINYSLHEKRCRTQLLLEYFGEVSYDECGICDICVAKKKKDHVENEHKYHDQIRHLLAASPLSIDDTVDQLNPGDKETFLEVIREMVDAGELGYDDQWRLTIK